MQVLFNRSCATPLSLLGSPGDPCSKNVFLFYNLRFWNRSSLLPQGISVSFALLLPWKCIPAAIPPWKLKEGEDTTADRSPSRSRILSSSYHYSIHTGHSTFHTCISSKVRSFSEAAPKGSSCFLQVQLFKMGSLVNLRDRGNMKLVNNHHLLLFPPCCSAHPCRSLWWRISFHSALCEMCISLYSAPGLRWKIEFVGQLWRFVWSVYSVFLHKPVEEAEVWSPKLAVPLKR